MTIWQRLEIPVRRHDLGHLVELFALPPRAGGPTIARRLTPPPAALLAHDRELLMTNVPAPDSSTPALLAAAQLEAPVSDEKRHHRRPEATSSTSTPIDEVGHKVLSIPVCSRLFNLSNT
ncbi:hypothetical protein HBB16_02480 [Pseudonocardia sp. MCCB 268]|nr:hypothetical protein [Pseudonocardia cytotoxica]